MTIEVKLGDIVRLRKAHPCGSYEWEVVRVGADIGLKCFKCRRTVLLERSVFERRVKTLVARSN
jgi:predicted RNase H-like HicB family nuclease